MSQPKHMSWLEASANTFGGFGIALVTQIVVFPWFGIHISLAENAAITGIFMAISLARGYAFRRFFNWIERRRREREWQMVLDIIDRPPAPNEALTRLMQG